MLKVEDHTIGIISEGSMIALGHDQHHDSGQIGGDNRCYFEWG